MSDRRFDELILRLRKVADDPMTPLRKQQVAIDAIDALEAEHPAMLALREWLIANDEWFACPNPTAPESHHIWEKLESARQHAREVAQQEERG